MASEQDGTEAAAPVFRAFLSQSLDGYDRDNQEQYGCYGEVLNLYAALAEVEEWDQIRRNWRLYRVHKPRLWAKVEGLLRDEETGEPFRCTDMGNAQRLVAQHHEDVRYVHDWGRWVVYDGKRWARDSLDAAMERAKATVRAIFTEAGEVIKPEIQKSLAKHALASQAHKRLVAMLALAQSDPRIATVSEVFDADPWLLNCTNGTVDLRTGELRPHRREDMLTKLCPVAFDPNAECLTWIRFVGEIFDQRRELGAFIRRALGYTLSGDTSERALFVCHGGGGNGKSTLLETIADMLGDYAMRTPAETLMVKREGQIPNDVAALRGARYVHASETEEGRRLAESFVKDLTGRDTIAARFMRGEWFQFRPVCKVWLRTNHKPVIRGTDEAMWDRLRLIPFEVRIPEHQQDRELPHKLREELPGILAWAVTGCLLWQVNGLGTPERVRAATQGYRDEMDRLGDFVDDCCVVTVEAQVTTKAIYSIYMAWCQRNGEPPLNRRAFAERLQERGFRPVRIGHEGARGWAGVGLLTPEG